MSTVNNIFYSESHIAVANLQCNDVSVERGKVCTATGAVG